MLGEDPAGDGKPQSRAAALAAPGGIGAVKPLEDMGRVLGAAIRTSPFSPRAARSWISPPAGVYLAALSARMRMACLSISRSAV